MTTLTANQLQPLQKGLWTSVGGSGYFLNPTCPTTMVYGVYQGANTFRWTVTYNDCSVYDQVIVSNNTFFIWAGDDQIVDIYTTNLNADPPEYGQVGTWSVVQGHGVFGYRNDPMTIATELNKGINIYSNTLQNIDNLRINLSDYKPGIYYLNIKTNTGEFMEKILIR